MFAPPGCSALPIFTDNNTKPDAGTTLALLTTLAQFQHSIAQFVANYPSRWWWWRRSNRHRRRGQGSCAAASCTGAAMAIVSKAIAPSDRYIVPPQNKWNHILAPRCGGTEVVGRRPRGLDALLTRLGPAGGKRRAYVASHPGGAIAQIDRFVIAVTSSR